MAHELEEMPLFPIPTVVFPYANLQLHVFEDRYRAMVNQCLDFDSPFGVVLARPGAEPESMDDPYMVGTAVRIVSVHTYEDGSLDVQVQGERRFRIRKLEEVSDRLVGYVEPVVELEYEDTPRVDALMMRAQESFKMYIEMVFSRSDFNIHIRFPSDPTALSFQIAEFLPLDKLSKQKFLELTDTQERLHDLIPLIERQIVEAKSPLTYRLTRQHLDEWIHPN